MLLWGSPPQLQGWPSMDAQAYACLAGCIFVAPKAYKYIPYACMPYTVYTIKYVPSQENRVHICMHVEMVGHSVAVWGLGCRRSPLTLGALDMPSRWHRARSDKPGESLIDIPGTPWIMQVHCSCALGKPGCRSPGCAHGFAPTYCFVRDKEAWPLLLICCLGKAGSGTPAGREA
jgi:hypothetical protein